MGILKIPRITTAQRLTTGGGITPDEGELLFDTDNKKIYKGDGSTLGGVEVGGGKGIEYTTTNAGPANTYTVTILGVTTYLEGDIYAIKFHATNTGPSTLQINSLTPAKSIVKNAGTALSANDILVDKIYILVYDGTEFQLVTLGGGTGDMTKAIYDVDDDGLVDTAEKIMIEVRNTTGSPVTRGQIVYLNSSSSSADTPEISLAANTSEALSTKTIGAVYNNSIANNATGFIVTNGELHGRGGDTFDTSAYNVGDKLWLGSTPGSVVTSPPSAPNHAVFIGHVTRKNNTNGRVMYSIQNGFEIGELHDVDLNTSSPTSGQFLRYDGSLWKNASLPLMVGATASVNGTAGLVPAPLIAERSLYLRGDGTWATNIATGTIASGTTRRLAVYTNTTALDDTNSDGSNVIFASPQTVNAVYTIPNTGTSDFVMTAGTQTIGGSKTFSVDTTFTTDIAVNGGDITTTTTGTATLFNTNALGLNIGGAATAINLGGTSTASINATFFGNATLSGNTKTINIGTAGANGSTTNIALGSAVNGALGTVTVQGGTSTSSTSASLRINGAGNVANASQLLIDGANMQSIDFGVGNLAIPSITTNRSAGTKLILYRNFNNGTSSADYAIGAESNAIWHSVPQATSTFSHKWYGGTTNIMTLRGDGLLTLSGLGNNSAATAAPVMYVNATNTNRTVLLLTGTCVTANGTIATYTTAAAHGFSKGQYVTITGVTSLPVNVFNVSLVRIVSVPTTTTFTISSSAANGNTGTSSGTASVLQINWLNAIQFDSTYGFLPIVSDGLGASSGNVRSIGTRLLFYNGLNTFGTGADTAIGLDGSANLWFTSFGGSIDFYGNTSTVATKLVSIVTGTTGGLTLFNNALFTASAAGISCNNLMFFTTPTTLLNLASAVQNGQPLYPFGTTTSIYTYAKESISATLAGSTQDTNINGVSVLKHDSYTVTPYLNTAVCQFIQSHFSEPTGVITAYTDIVVGSDVTVVSTQSTLIPNGYAVRLQDTSGLTGIDTVTTYYVYSHSVGASFKLAASFADATAATPIPISSATGTYSGGTKSFYYFQNIPLIGRMHTFQASPRNSFYNGHVLVGEFIEFQSSSRNSGYPAAGFTSVKSLEISSMFSTSSTGISSVTGYDIYINKGYQRGNGSGTIITYTNFASIFIENKTSNTTKTDSLNRTVARGAGYTNAPWSIFIEADKANFGGGIRIDSASTLTSSLIHTNLHIQAATTAKSQIRLISSVGVNPTTNLADGDIWYDGTALKIRIGTTTRTVQVL